MASREEITLLADEGISLTINRNTLDILGVSIDGIGKITWVVPEERFEGNFDPIWQNT